ncbi:MAG TPA: hypothetical protein VNG69_15305 [Casimicrobiaceae bacterium]|nr:hypothetical protein [Casimicrobiaceae bacterium]
MTQVDLEAKKQLLIAQAEFDRLKLTMAMHDVRRMLRPSFAAADAADRQSATSRIMGFAIPLFGRSQLRSVARAISLALSVYRFLRGFH